MRTLPEGGAARHGAAHDRPSRLVADLGGTKTAVARVAGRDVLERHEAATPAHADPEEACTLLASLLGSMRLPGEAIGVAVTGRVTRDRVRAVNLRTLPRWTDVPLAAMLEAWLDAPVHLLNDAQAAALGEARYGAGTTADPVAFVTLSTGLGAGLVVAGRPLTGAHGLAGHFGFWRDVSGPQFDPQRDGVDALPLEASASGTALTAAARRAFGEGADARSVVAAARDGDEGAARVLDEVLRPAARALRNLQWLFDPERIVIGGGLGLASGVLARLDALASDPPMTHDGVRPRLVPAVLGIDAGLIGMAAHLDDIGAAQATSPAP